MRLRQRSQTNILGLQFLTDINQLGRFPLDLLHEALATRTEFNSNAVFSNSHGASPVYIFACRIIIEILGIKVHGPPSPIDGVTQGKEGKSEKNVVHRLHSWVPVSASFNFS